MGRAGVFWNIERSPASPEIDVRAALDGLVKRLLARDLQPAMIFVTGYAENNRTIQKMAEIEGADRVLCSPIFAGKEEDQATGKLIIEMTMFVRDNPGCTVVFVSDGDDDGHGVFFHYLNDNGIPWMLVVDNEEGTSGRLKRRATEVWEWADICADAGAGAGLSED